MLMRLTCTVTNERLRELPVGEAPLLIWRSITALPQP
jgi:hypothetical protein